ncbi:hybrid sensor histidine kinase/response regulator [Seonamhaeicola marinus]|uniref:histidine kinase n=1 Tax=Seonamhaeicola marinus TaxID=1912246 RepID=A0A5D0IV88_9FLAO|nr:ATP-binding protein [Seonamhaeicola marinus]TYA86750.1 response regulator [Seonamhaeicola marinus]
MHLTDLKQKYKVLRIQFITTDVNGIIKESDNKLFVAKQGFNLGEIHPFFKSIIALFSAETLLDFTCVHLELNSKTFTCDIEVKVINDNLFLVIITDFSKHYESFQSLVQSRNETSILSESLILKNKLLREQEAFKNKFISNFSHEVKSPIASIISFTNLLKDTNLKEEQEDYLNLIINSSIHLKSIINDILDLSKIEKGKLEIKNSEFNFRSLIDKISAHYSHKCKNKALEFITNIDESIPVIIESDETRIAQVIQNLLDNALKFTKEGSISLEIKQLYYRAQNASISVVVKDTGPGIKEEDYDAIFKRFDRLENTNTIEGIGLGLSIVKEIIDLMNGEIYVNSEPNKGSTFTVVIKVKTLPIKKEERQNISIKKFQPKGNRKPNILLVEDNATHQLSIFKTLAKTKKFFLDIVDNGFDAVKSVNNVHYDVILMDYKIHFLDGVETAKTIRRMDNKQKSKTPIVLITSQIINANLLQHKGELFNDILEKPFEEERLLNAILNSLK